MRVWPTLTIEGPGGPAPLEGALAALERFDWIAFTSARAVDALAERMPAPRGRPRVAAVGEATAAALRERGWPVDHVGRGDGAEALVGELAGAGVGAGRGCSSRPAPWRGTCWRRGCARWAPT